DEGPTAGPGHFSGLDRVQADQDRGAAERADGALPAPGPVQRRADPREAPGRGRAGRPDVVRHLRPDGRDRRVRHGAGREVRDVLRPAHPRRDPRRAAVDGLGPAARPLPVGQARRGHQAARGAARPGPDEGGAGRPAAGPDGRVREDGQGPVGRRRRVAEPQVVRDGQQQGRPRDRRARGQAGGQPGPRDAAEGPEGAADQGPEPGRAADHHPLLLRGDDDEGDRGHARPEREPGQPDAQQHPRPPQGPDGRQAQGVPAGGGGV
ncbi:MAG: RNA polymerase sigma factor for flagellar operon, partial [uncultured Phycisphaerae bacterium]